MTEIVESDASTNVDLINKTSKPSQMSTGANLSSFNSALQISKMAGVDLSK